MRKSLIFLAISGLVTAGTVQGQFGDPPTLENRNASGSEYYMLEVPDGVDMIADGQDDDWAWFDSEYTLNMDGWRDEGGRALPASDDLDIIVKMAWKGAPENRWYVFMKIHDDVLSHEGNNVLRWDGDMLGFGLDPQDNGRDRGNSGHGMEFVAAPGDVTTNYRYRYTNQAAWSEYGQAPWFNGTVRVEPTEAWAADSWTSDTGGETIYEFNVVVLDLLEAGGPSASQVRDLNAQAGWEGFGLPFLFFVEDGDPGFQNDMGVRGVEASSRQYFAHALLLRTDEYTGQKPVTEPPITAEDETAEDETAQDETASEGSEGAAERGGWKTVYSGSISGIAADPQADDGFFLLSNGAFSRSEDGGNSWQELSRPGGVFKWFVHVDPKVSEKTYIGNNSQLLFSNDGGVSWGGESSNIGEISDLTSTVSGDDVTLFAVARNGGEKAVYRSADRGMTWEIVIGPLETWMNMRLFVDPLNPDKVFVASEEGVAVSGDGGDTWTQIDNIATAFVGGRGSRIYTARLRNRSAGLFRSDDLGGTWVAVNTPKPFHKTISGENWSSDLFVILKALAVNPANPDVLYLTGIGPGEEDGAWLSRSVDGGDSWETIAIGGEFPWPDYRIVFNPDDPSIVYADIDNELVRGDFDDPEYVPPEEEEVDIGDLIGGIRSAGRWTLHRTVNLGPKAGNGEGGLDIAVDAGRNRAFVGNNTNISIVDLRLNMVTGVLPADQFGFTPDHTRKVQIAINTTRDELYLHGRIGSCCVPKFFVLDLNSLALKKGVHIENTAPGGTLVEEETGLVYLVTRGSYPIVAIDPEKGEVQDSLRTSGGGGSEIQRIAMGVGVRKLFALYKPSGCIKTAENQPCSATLSLAVPLENGDLWC